VGGELWGVPSSDLLERVEVKVGQIKINSTTPKSRQRGKGNVLADHLKGNKLEKIGAVCWTGRARAGGMRVIKRVKIRCEKSTTTQIDFSFISGTHQMLKKEKNDATLGAQGISDTIKKGRIAGLSKNRIRKRGEGCQIQYHKKLADITGLPPDT